MQLVRQPFVCQAFKWNRDVKSIGRILRSHLYVEHFLTEFLRSVSSGLGDLDEARLTFVQKVALVGSSSPDVQALIGGIRRLNQIRNRLAHDLMGSVSQDDADVFLSLSPFARVWAPNRTDEGNVADGDRTDAAPIDVLEAFAKFASRTLQKAVRGNSEEAKAAFEQALRELSG